MHSGQAGGGSPRTRLSGDRSAVATGPGPRPERVGTRRLGGGEATSQHGDRPTAKTRRCTRRLKGNKGGDDTCGAESPRVKRGGRHRNLSTERQLFTGAVPCPRSGALVTRHGQWSRADRLGSAGLMPAGRHGHRLHRARLAVGEPLRRLRSTGPCSSVSNISAREGGPDRAASASNAPLSRLGWPRASSSSANLPARGTQADCRRRFQSETGEARPAARPEVPQGPDP